MSEQRYQAVLRVISDGETVKDVAAWCGVSRQTMHAWLAKYEVNRPDEERADDQEVVESFREPQNERRVSAEQDKQLLVNWLQE